MKNKIITIFGSGKVDVNSPEYHQAFELGRLIAEAGYTVCNGGYGGIMEATASGAKSKNGKTIGVVVEQFGTNANKFIDEKIITRTLLERLSKLIELGDAYIILPGASGTLVELATIWEFMIKGLMKIKPIFSIGNFWDEVIKTINSRLIYENNERFTKLIRKTENVYECAEALKNYFNNLS